MFFSSTDRCSSMTVVQQPSFSVDVTVVSFTLPCVTSCVVIMVYFCAALRTIQHILRMLFIALHKDAILFCEVLLLKISLLRKPQLLLSTYVRPLYSTYTATKLSLV